MLQMAAFLNTGCVPSVQELVSVIPQTELALARDKAVPLETFERYVRLRSANFGTIDDGALTTRASGEYSDDVIHAQESCRSSPHACM